MSEQILKVENLNVFYGMIQALRGISFEVNRGEIVSIVPERFQEKNLAAFAAGYKIGEENYADQ